MGTGNILPMDCTPTGKFIVSLQVTVIILYITLTVITLLDF